MKRMLPVLPLLLLTLLVGIEPVARAADTAGGAEFEGLIEPSAIVNVGTPVAGVVDQVAVERSDLVKKGDTLVRIESSVEQATLERARALAEAEGEVRLHESKLAHDRRMQGRIEELFKSEAISAEKRDEAVTEASLSRSRLQKAQEDNKLARLDVERARAVLAQRTIHSPISGVVLERLVAPGEFVDDKPLLRLAALDPLHVEAILPAALFHRITPGMQAEVRPDHPEGGSFPARVTIVDRVIDPASGTFGVRLELPNPDYRLPSGLKCTLRFAGLEPADAVAAGPAPAGKPEKTTP